MGAATGAAWALQAGGSVRQLESADDDSRGSDEPESTGRLAALASCAVPWSPGLTQCESSESADAAGAGVLGPSLLSTLFLRYEFQ